MFAWIVFHRQELLLIASMAGGVAVGAAIISESIADGHAWTRETICVVIGVFVEAVATLLLFKVDEGISNEQQSTIIKLETRLEARTLTLSDARDISDTAEKFPRQEFEVVAYWDDKESADFGEHLSAALSAGDWVKYRPTATPVIVGVVAGIVLYVDAEAPATTGAAAQAIADELIAKHIGAVVRQSNNRPASGRVNITVGIKP
jgi:hypothetical protein